MTLLRLFCIVSCFSACKSSKESPVETGKVETGAPDTDSGETGESGSDTGRANLALLVFPEHLVVDVGTGWTLQSVAGGAEVQASYSSSDSAVVSVSASGVVQALGSGEAQITANWQGLIAESTVLVQSQAALQVHVFSGKDGTALSGARVMVDAQLELTDESGMAQFSLSDTQPVDILIYGETANVYTSALFLDVVPRDVALPLRLRNADDAGRSELAGAVDLSGTLMSGPDEKAAGLVTLGLAAPSFQSGALFFPLEQLFAANREVSIGGIAVELPGNLFLREAGESWQGTAHSGPVSVWAFGGPVPLAGLASGLSGFSEVLAFLVPHFDAFTWTGVSGLQASESTPLQVDLRPDVEFDDRIEIQLAAFPAGIPTDSNALLIALSGPMDGGPMLTGMGQGKLTANMSRVSPDAADPDATGPSQGSVLAIAEVGGFGSGGAQTLALAQVKAGVASVGAWQDLASIDSFDRHTMAFSLATDTKADFTRLHIRSASGTRRDVYLPAGAHSRTLSLHGPSMGYANTEWTVLGVETLGRSYEALLATGGLSPESLPGFSITTARTVAQFLPVEAR
jgi:hypothetical protein